MADTFADNISGMARARRRLAQRLQFFDSNVWFGQPQGFPLAQELAPERLREMCEGRYITGGLVSHWYGKTLSAQDGNAALMQAIDGQDDGFLAVWTALPLSPAESEPVPGSGELPERVGAVRIFPRSHNFPLSHWCVGPLCEWLCERRMPLLTWHTELDWDDLHRLASAFPALPIVVETQTQKILYHTRPLFALMRDCRNVHVELSNFAGQGFIEYAAREFGAERLVFGSFLPMNDPFVPMGMVLDARIAEQDKALIAGGNLRRLLGEVRR